MKFSHDWFSQNIPNFEKINSLTSIKTVLEIGVYEGMSTCWMLDKMLPSNASILCIDPLENEEVYEAFIQNVATVKKDNQTVTFYKQTSVQTLPYLLMQPTRYDFIYVDGSHQAPDVLFDVVNSWQILRQGGVMLLDDYGGGDTVKEAAEAFLYIFREKYNVVVNNYQLGLQKL